MPRFRNIESRGGAGAQWLFHGSEVERDSKRLAQKEVLHCAAEDTVLHGRVGARCTFGVRKVDRWLMRGLTRPRLRSG
jgi:hypothetical protein